MINIQCLPCMLRDKISQLRMNILVVFCKLIKYSLSILIPLTIPSLSQSLVYIIAPALRSQVSGIYPEMILATLPYGAGEILLYGRVDPRMGIYFLLDNLIEE